MSSSSLTPASRRRLVRRCSDQTSASGLPAFGIRGHEESQDPSERSASYTAPQATAAPAERAPTTVISARLIIDRHVASLAEVVGGQSVELLNGDVGCGFPVRALSGVILAGYLETDTPKGLVHDRR